MPNKATKFVGIQIGPISFIDEGVAPLLDLLQARFGVNVLLIGALSWLGLKVGGASPGNWRACPTTDGRSLTH